MWQCGGLTACCGNPRSGRSRELEGPWQRAGGWTRLLGPGGQGRTSSGTSAAGSLDCRVGLASTTGIQLVLLRHIAKDYAHHVRVIGVDAHL
jgi:hypothetical protein